MIYITGDFHGDKSRFGGKGVRWLGRRDTLILCGDFGFLWNGGPEEKKTLDWIAARRYSVLFVEGTHDNLDLLAQYPVEEWCGGLTHHLGGNLRHLIRGQTFTAEGKTFLALGGGENRDEAQREEGVNWWGGSLPSLEELVGYRAALAKVGNRLDFILSHQAPTNVDSCFTGKVCEVTPLTAFMDEVQRSCAFEGWYFGCYHQNRVVPPKYFGLYDQVRALKKEKGNAPRL